jgi:hypothetical protein
MSQITVRSQDSITVTNSQGKTLAGWQWDGSTLRHPGGTAWTATPAMAARIGAAIAEVVPARTERLGGLALSQLPAADREGWEWDGRMDGNGGYVRTFGGTCPAPLSYVPADFGK